MFEAGQFRANAKVLWAEKQKSSSQKQNIFKKIKLLLRLAAFIDALLPEAGLVHIAKEKWDLEHVHSVTVSLHPSGKALVIWDTITHR